MSGRTFCEKTFVSQNFLLSWIFWDTWRTIFKNCRTLPGRAIEKATYVSGGTLWRKTKCLRERCFFINVFGLWSEKFSLSKKNCLGSKTSILRVLRNVLGENFCIKNLFFCIILSELERKIFGLSTKLFSGRLSSFHSTFAEEGFREKNLEKKFFHCFQSWSKNWLLKKHQVECKNFYLRVRKFFLSKNIPFKVIWYFFSGISSESFEKNFRRIVKKSFYMSRGTSWWN